MGCIDEKDQSLKNAKITYDNTTTLRWYCLQCISFEKKKTIHVHDIDGALIRGLVEAKPKLIFDTLFSGSVNSSDKRVGGAYRTCEKACKSRQHQAYPQMVLQRVNKQTLAPVYEFDALSDKEKQPYIDDALKELQRLSPLRFDSADSKTPSELIGLRYNR